MVGVDLAIGLILVAALAGVGIGLLIGNPVRELDDEL
jgi:hypothetical protein